MKIISKKNEHFYFSAQNRPVERVKNGETVVFECQDCYCEQILEDGFPFEKMDMKRNNPATGPIYIEEAMPGDVLKVEILKIDLASSGCICARKGAGIYDIEGSHCKRYEVKDGMVHFMPDIRFAIQPMIGVIGVAPESGEISTQSPGEHGGNLDIKNLGEGTVLYLPVNTEGAFLSMGDLHAVQGDGETVICALEISGNVTVRVNVLKGRTDIPTPFIVTPTHYITTYAAESLDEASKTAARKMHKFLQEHSELSDLQCGLLLSMQGNLRISQIVNPLQGCIMDFPRGLIHEVFEL